MTRRRKLILATAGVVMLILAGSEAYSVATTPTGCVTVYVDFGVLKNHETVTTCVPAGHTVSAPDALHQAGLQLAGTDKYKGQIVCRVNGLPSAVAPVPVKDHATYVEHCTDMPAAFAYWAVLIKRHENGNPLDMNTRWGWAQTGVQDVKLHPGDSIGLVFADNDNVRFPN